jgi:hypothetical protein
MYRWLQEPRPTSDLGAWASLAGGYSLVVGYTMFGDFFLRHPKTREFAILTTMSPDLVPVGHDERRSFESEFLRDEDVIVQVLRPADVSLLEERLGRLLEDEVFIPVPYPFQGGSGRLDTYDKGDVWVFAGLIAQAHGIDTQ